MTASLPICVGIGNSFVTARHTAFTYKGIGIYRRLRTATAHTGRRCRVSSLSPALTGILTWIMSDKLGLHYMLTQPLITLIVMAWTFAGNQFWAFASHAA